ncbi:ABC transporter substrate-binding protein [Thermaerobacter litoralis]
MAGGTKGRRRAALALLLVAGLLALAGCGGGGQPAGGGAGGSSQGGTGGQPVPGVTADTVVVGTFMPLSGPAAAWGELAKGLKAYFTYVNEQGGVNGRKFKFIVEDDQYQPSRSVAAAKKLVEQDQVFALVAPVGTSNLTAVRDYLKQHGVPVVAYMNGATKFSQPVDPLLFAGLMSYKREANLLVRYAVETLKITKLGVFYQNDDFGRDGLEGAKAAAARMGAQIVAEVSYAPADVSVAAQALRLKEAGAEGVLIWSTVKHAALLMQEAQKIGYKPKWLASAVVTSPSLIELAGEAAQGTYFAAYSATVTDTDHPVVKEFLELYPKYEKTPITPTNLTGWAAARLFVEAVRRAGPDLTRESLIAALESMQDFESLGPVTYTKDDHSGYRQGFIRQLQGQQFVRVSDWIPAE